MNRIFKGALFGALIGGCLSVGANAATLTPAPAQVNFASLQAQQALGSISAPQIITLSGDATIVAVGLDSPNFTMVNTSCIPGATLPCTFAVKFSPVAPGSRYAEVSILSTATPSLTLVGLQGEAALTLPQTLTITAGSATYGSGSFAVSATSSVGLAPVAITVAAGSAGCSGGGNDSATITFSGAGNCTVTANHPGSAAYSAATASIPVAIAKAIPQISRTAPGSVTFAAGVTFAIGSSSPSPVAIVTTSATPGTCTVTNSTTVSMVAAGTCTLNFNQAANQNYEAATQVTANVTLSNLTAQTISFGAAPGVTVGGTGTVSANATSGLGVTYSSTTPSICTISGNTVTGVAEGTCTIAADQAGNGTYAEASRVSQSFAIAAAPPTQAGCDMSKDFFSASSRLQYTSAGLAQAFPFVAGNGGQLKTQYPSVNIYISVSATACEFVNVPPKCAASGYVEPGLYYSASDTRKCILTPGQTYYFNVRTGVKDSSGAIVETCTSGQCSYMPALF